MTSGRISRRTALKASLAGAALPLVHIRTAGAAGKLSLGIWDHWTGAPANDAFRAIVMAWAEKNAVDVQLDFITSVGNKNLLTIAAEAQAKQGHDILSHQSWTVQDQRALLEPMDDVMGRLIAKYGAINPVPEYLGKSGGKWIGVPQTTGSQYKGAVARMDLMKEHVGLDVRAMYPAKNELGPGADGWDYEALLVAADKCNKAGYPFALPAGSFPDATDWIGSMFAAYDAHLVDREGNVTIRGNDHVRQVLEYAKRLFRHVPNEMFAADDATNNRALIAGKTALIFNPPSAWAVARRDAPDVAKQVWHFPSPSGPAGRFVPHLPYFYGLWSFSRNKTAAKELIEHLSQVEQIRKMVGVSMGYDIPPFASMLDQIDTWATVEPPLGTVYNYPVRPHHKATAYMACSSAPPDIAVQLYTSGVQAKMIARLVQSNEPMDRVLAWAEQEVEGFKRG